MSRLKALLFACTLVLAAPWAQAQNAGYAGKRLVVKTEALNGIKGGFTGVGLEYVPFKRASLSVMLNSSSYKVGQRYGSSEYENGFSSDIPERMPDRADIEERSITLEGRIYFVGTNSPPAPNGSFFYSNLSSGRVDVEGSYFLELLQPSDDLFNENTQVIPYSLTNVDFFQLETGLGYQRVIYDWVTIGFTTGVNYTRFRVDSGEAAEKVFSGVAKSAGANVYGLGGNIVGDRTSANAGITFQLQIGILII